MSTATNAVCLTASSSVHFEKLCCSLWTFAHPRTPRGSWSGREKGRDKSFQVRAKKPLGTDYHRIISKTFKRLPAPDWAKKMLCIIVPNRQAVSPSFFSWVRTRLLFSTGPNQKSSETEELPMSRKNVWDAINRSNSICPENILLVTHHNVS